ncbi:MAG: hypothetical protein Q8L51_01255 [Candidatus Amesbacteria bacterium]|nr:hypothetical protein [Candidatus Amesbacteria bacterium]
MITECAMRNYQIIANEALRRERARLSIPKTDPCQQVLEYLRRVSWSYPDINLLTDLLIFDENWKKQPKMIVTIPIASFGNQEQESIRKTLEVLSVDQSVKSGETGLLILGNRPEGKLPDTTMSVAKAIIFEKGLNAIALECTIPNVMGNTDGPFSDEMATNPNDVPIGLIRDILSICAMKLYVNELSSTSSNSLPPIIMQMDGDFQGFRKGDISKVLNDFSNNKLVNFIQYTSDWDSDNYPTKSIPLLWLGSELMREIPQILKLPLNWSILPKETRKQIIFGEAVQRGIQVPQAERMESVARKAGFGLNRVKEDELDSNIRMTAYVSGLDRINTSNQVVFDWSNRRAVESWKLLRQPPISQWVSSFSAEDPVRRKPIKTDETKTSSSEEKLEVINKTLARFPIPSSLPEVYSDFTIPLLMVLRRCNINITPENYSIIEKEGGTWIIQLNSME